MIKLVFFAGSARRDSLNKKLAQIAAKSAQNSQVQSAFIDLADFNIPMYHSDVESDLGTPVDVKKLKAILADADGIFIASPEYNGAYTGLLKNTIDWMSRKNHDSEIAPFSNSVVAISSTSPGPRGGLGGLTALRLVINHIGGLVIPAQAAIGSAAYNDDGSFMDGNHQKVLNKVLDQLISTASAIKTQ